MFADSSSILEWSTVKFLSVKGSDRDAIVDDVDYGRVSGIAWRLSVRNRDPRYVVSDARVNGRMVKFLLHREILDAPDGVKVDHKDCDTLNNIRSNLRLATDYQSAQNTRKTKGCTSSHKGVSWDKDRGLWRVKIIAGGKTHRLGRFENEEFAARLYDEAAVRYHGEFAVLNFPVT